MGRPISDGLIYFSFDCNFFSDKKIKVLKANFGVEGIAVYTYLLCEIYKVGYYLELDSDFEYIISDDLNISSEKVKEIIEFLSNHYLFDRDNYKNNNILTSKGIQRRFQAAIKEKAKKTPRNIGDYWLLDECETLSYLIVTGKTAKNNNYSEKNIDISDNYDTKKIKENKEKEIKINKIKENKEELSFLFNSFKKNISSDLSENDILLLTDISKIFDTDLIIECIKIAVDKNKKSLGYVNGILNNLKQDGITTFEQYERRKNNGHSSNSNSSEIKYNGNYGTVL